MEPQPQQQQPQQAHQPLRRRRPAVSCVLCRRRKVRCDRQTPCSNCRKSQSDICVYDTAPTPLSRLHGSHQSQTSLDVESMKSQIRRLEELVQRVTCQPISTPAPSSQPTAITLPSSSSSPQVPPATPYSNAETTSYAAGLFHLHHGNPTLGQRPDMNRAITHKRRMFGQSHWINSTLILCQDLIDLIEEFARNDRSNVISGLQRVKGVARMIKARRTPPWPCSPTPDLPPKDIADKLLECYKHTSESVHRVLHVPSFMSQYEALCNSENPQVDSTFLVLLKLALAIGAATYDDNFTLRPSAIRWVYEAETWLANPTLKHRLDLQYFQIYLLSLLARETTAIGEDLVWISTGGLLRAAVHMGLHRDPVHLPRRTVFANEMHRRLWNTIIEFCLNSSLNHGGPPLLSLDDFDTQPPGNFDDEQLSDNNAVPKPENEFSQSSVAIALRRIWPARLNITKFLNCIGTRDSYEDTLGLDADFRQAYKRLRSTFQGFNSTGGPVADQFALRLVDIILHRYIISLHMPFFVTSLKETAFAYSRKVALDSSLKTWYALSPSSAMMAPVDPLSSLDGLERMSICGSGLLRIALLTAPLVIAVELREQLKEDDGLASVPLRRDLLAIVEEAKVWQFRCVEAGETNIKGYMFAVLISAQIEGLMKGLKRSELATLLITKAHEADERCTATLEGMLGQSQPDQNIEILGEIPLETTPGSLEGWDYIMPGMGIESGGADPMAWMFHGNMQGDFNVTW